MTEAILKSEPDPEELGLREDLEQLVTGLTKTLNKRIEVRAQVTAELVMPDVKEFISLLVGESGDRRDDLVMRFRALVRPLIAEIRSATEERRARSAESAGVAVRECIDEIDRARARREAQRRRRPRRSQG